MRTVLWVLGVILAGWLVYTVAFKCDDTKSIPYCIGWAAKSMVSEVMSGISD